MPDIKVTYFQISEDEYSHITTTLIENWVNHTISPSFAFKGETTVPHPTERTEQNAC